jgi:eukaryotic-like serine/threonine-protein kinase
VIVAPGTLLGGRYEVLKRLATGGMATVHLARAVGVGGFERVVAIKVMHPQYAAEGDFVTMFLDEARLAARIRHPNVVPTLDIQQIDEGLFLVMEFIDGPSLQQVVKTTGARPGGIPLGIGLRILVDTLAGLHAAHELTDDEGQPQNLIHRDVSPVNVLLGVDGIARLTDFGVARAEARLSSTRGGQLKGKVPFMPPEQLMNEELDRRCDVYAAGAVAWEVFTGTRLFRADSEGALLTQILAGNPPSPRELLPTLPTSIEQVVMRALARSRADRHPTAAAFCDALEAAAESAGVTIATSRSVAAFLEGAGFRKLDPKELASLKQGAGAGAGAAAGAGAGAAARSSSPGIPPPAPPPPEPAVITSPSQVTAADVAISTAAVAPRPRRSAGVVVAGVAVLGLVVGAGLFLASRKDAPASDAAAASPAAPSVPASAVAAPLADSALVATSSASAPATATASSTPTTPATKRPSSPASTQGGPTARPTAKPAAAGTSYNPDRL